MQSEEVQPAAFWAILGGEGLASRRPGDTEAGEMALYVEKTRGPALCHQGECVRAWREARKRKALNASHTAGHREPQRLG